MKKFEEDKIIIKTEDGNEKVFYKMITFNSTKTNKSYLIYVDDESNEIYSSIIISKEDEIKLEKIVDEEDMEEVKKALIKAKASFESTNTLTGEVV